MPTAQEIPTTSPIGRNTPRIDGPLKVSGTAHYASDFHFPGLLYAVPVEATIANGRITKLDTAAAEKMPGVRAILHRKNIGKIFRSSAGKGNEGICIERRPAFEDDVVRYYGQYVALAVADTFESAKAAADAVVVTYAKQKPNVDFKLTADNDLEVVETSYGPEKRVQSERGNAAAAFASAPVKLVLSRKMTFQAAGHRAHTQQRMRLGATPEGKLVSLQQDYVYERSMLDDYHENCGEATSFHYSVPNLRVHFGRARRNIGTPSDMRGPGAVPGLYATESAMNELADQLKLDPVQLRILNEPKIDEGEGVPFSSRHYVECLQFGSEKFGWSKRNAEVGSMKRDGLTLGWGVAGAAWIATRDDAAANVELRDDGSARVACGVQDIGTGTYTVLALLTADKTGVPVEKVEVVRGDTTLPHGPGSGGSWATASW